MSHIHINFEHVNYSYEKTVPILQDITFIARENDSIGLIGANGVGKSTLLKLLVGLNPDYEGSIRAMHWNRFTSGIYGTSRFISCRAVRKKWHRLPRSLQ